MGNIQFKKSTLLLLQEKYNERESQASQRSSPPSFRLQSENSQHFDHESYQECESRDDVLEMYSREFAIGLNEVLGLIDWNPNKYENNSFKCSRRFMSYLISDDGEKNFADPIELCEIAKNFFLSKYHST